MNRRAFLATGLSFAAIAAIPMQKMLAEKPNSLAQEKESVSNQCDLGLFMLLLLKLRVLPLATVLAIPC